MLQSCNSEKFFIKVKLILLVNYLDTFIIGQYKIVFPIYLEHFVTCKLD